MILFNSSFENINVVIPDLIFFFFFFFWIDASTSDNSKINPNGIRTLLADGLSTLSIKGKPDFSNGPRSLPKNPPNCIILDSWVFGNFTLDDEQGSKSLRILEACVSVNNNLCGKLVSSSESQIAFDERFKVTWVQFYIYGVILSHFVLILY